MNRAETTSVIARIEDSYDETFDGERIGRWARALADADAAAIGHALERWIGTERWTPKPSDLLQAAPNPATSSSGPDRGIRDSTAYFQQGVVRDNDGEMIGAVIPDGGGWWLKPLDQVTDLDIQLLRRVVGEPSSAMRNMEFS